MTKLVSYRRGFLIPDHIERTILAVGITKVVSGSGVNYSGDVAFVILPNSIAVISPTGDILKNIHFESIVKVDEIEFRGLTEEEKTEVGWVTVAPNERSGFEVMYRELGGNYQWSLRILTYYANVARDWIETLNSAIAVYYRNKHQSGQIDRNRKSEG